MAVALFLLVLDLIKALALLFAARVAGARIELKKPEVGGIAAGIELESLIEKRLSLCRVVIERGNLAEFGQRIGLAGMERERLPEFSDGFIEPALLSSDDAKVEIASAAVALSSAA